MHTSAACLCIGPGAGADASSVACASPGDATRLRVHCVDGGRGGNMRIIDSIFHMITGNPIRVSAAALSPASPCVLLTHPLLMWPTGRTRRTQYSVNRFETCFESGRLTATNPLAAPRRRF